MEYLGETLYYNYIWSAKSFFMHSILTKIDQLAKQVPEGYSEKEKDAYKSACEAVKEIFIKSMNPVLIKRNQAKQIKIRVDIDGRLAHRRKMDNRHPIRLVIYHDKKVKRYAISSFKSLYTTDPDKLYFQKEEWKTLWITKGSRIRKDMERFEKKIGAIVEAEIQPFSFERFEKKMGLK